MKPLSVRLAEALVAAQDKDTHVIVMTPGAVDELVALVEAAETLLAAWNATSRGRFGVAVAHPELEEAIMRLTAIVRLQGLSSW